MASLTDLFNPTFLMFLGILVLVVALVVVYFESKLREQNHKIASMFSIVSTLAEDVTGMKMGVNQLMNFNNTIGGSMQTPLENTRIPYEQNTKLIEVSDDEESDNESEIEDGDSDVEDVEVEDDDSDVEDVEEDDSSLGKYMDDMESEPDSLSESDLEHIEQEKITVFKLKEDGDENIENVEDESIDELASELSDGDLGDIENVEEEPIKEESVLDVSELKTISINLEEPVEKIDYKKLQLPKLKSIVVEKGLATNSDASKLKKAELLKLLGIE
jgi:hypothetical protein